MSYIPRTLVKSQMWYQALGVPVLGVNTSKSLKITNKTSQQNQEVPRNWERSKWKTLEECYFSGHLTLTLILHSFVRTLFFYGVCGQKTEGFFFSLLNSACIRRDSFYFFFGLFASEHIAWSANSFLPSDNSRNHRHIPESNLKSFRLQMQVWDWK